MGETNNDVDYVFKVILVGDCGVGKSSLLLRYADEFFQESYLCTIGVDLRIRTLTVDEKVVKLHLWDTAGQERFKTLCSHYYRGAQAICIVYDVTDVNSFSNVKKWHEEAKVICPEDCVLVLMGNKCDLSADRTVTTEQGQALAENLNMLYFETSAKSSDNVGEAFVSTTRKMIQVYHHRHHRQELADDATTINKSRLLGSKPIKSKGLLSLNCFDCSIM